MGPPPFAFSVHHFINSVGSDAGFASIIGLAILVLLYFAHARETAALREHAEQSAARVQELEARVSQLARQGNVAPVVPPNAAPTPMPAGATRAPAPASAAGVAAAAYPGRGTAGPPAGVAAPPLTAATRLIPAGGAVSGSGAQASTAAPPTLPPATSAPPTLPPATSAPPTAGPPGAPATAAGARASTNPPSPVPAQSGSNGTGEFAAPANASRPPVQTARAGSGMVAGARGVAGQPPRRATAPRGARGIAQRILPVLVAGVVVAGIVVALIALTSGGGKTSANATPPASNAPTAHHRATAKAFNPASVTVVVLNGTPTTGLAHRISTKLGAAGFKQGTPAQASDATRQATIVAYLPGHVRDALAVAKSLKLGSSQVQRIDAATQAIACPPPAACAATVVVTVGADLANQ